MEKGWKNYSIAFARARSAAGGDARIIAQSHQIRITKKAGRDMQNLFARALPAMLAVCVAVCTAQSGAARAAAYPERPVTMIVAFAAGGATDISSRIVGKYLGQALNQQFVIDNRGGGGGMIAASAVMRAKPDGYTLLSS